MSAERPDFCQRIDCPNYPGYGDCWIRRWVVEGWFSPARRKEILAEYEELAEEDPKQVIRECLEKSFER